MKNAAALEIKKGMETIADGPTLGCETNLYVQPYGAGEFTRVGGCRGVIFDHERLAFLTLFFRSNELDFTGATIKVVIDKEERCPTDVFIFTDYRPIVTCLFPDGDRESSVFVCGPYGQSESSGVAPKSDQRIEQLINELRRQNIGKFVGSELELELLWRLFRGQ